MSRPIRIRLTETDFEMLTGSNEIITEDINGQKVIMILADIGYDRMQNIIMDHIIKDIE